MPERIEVELTLRGESAEQAKNALTAAGGDGVKSHSALGLTGVEEIIFAVMVVEGMAKLVTTLVRQWRCGIVVVAGVDGKKVSTEKNCDIPRGSVLLVHPD